MLVNENNKCTLRNPTARRSPWKILISVIILSEMARSVGLTWTRCGLMEIGTVAVREIQIVGIIMKLSCVIK